MCDREDLKLSWSLGFERSLEDRIDRWISVKRQWITGDHHFAHASAECLDLYRDGYFLSCVMVSQAVSDGIAKFVASRNHVTRQKKETNQLLVSRLRDTGFVSDSFVEAFNRIQGSFRNDYHHMNPPVGHLDHAALAERNIADLALIEREIFECDQGPGGTIVPKQPLYWGIAADSSIRCYLRLT